MPYKDKKADEQYHQQYYKQYRPKQVADKKNWRKEHPEEYRIQTIRQNYKRNYGLTMEQVDSFIAERGGRCDICHEPEPNGRRLHVDHSHQPPYKFRGMLCGRCNRAPGLMDDLPDRLIAAATYLTP